MKPGQTALRRDVAKAVRAHSSDGAAGLVRNSFDIRDVVARARRAPNEPMETEEMNRKTISLATAACALALAAAAPGLAREAHRFPFDEIDANGDGYLDKAEIESHRDARFAAADTNGDGALSMDELAKARETRAEGRARHGGKRPAMSFEELDADGNGTISREEFEHARQRAGERFRARLEKRRAAMLERLDANGDGLLQKEEMAALAPEGMFARIDADGDGRISREEAARMGKGRFGRRHHGAD